MSKILGFCTSRSLASKNSLFPFSPHHRNENMHQIIPFLNSGPPIHPITDLKHINFSTDQLYSLFNGQNEFIPPSPFASYVSPPQPLFLINILKVPTNSLFFWHHRSTSAT